MYENVAVSQQAVSAPVRQGPSGLGITSLILGIISILLLVLIFLAAVGVAARAHGGAIDNRAPEVVGLGLVVMLGVLLALVGTGFGIGGVAQKRRKRGLGVAGLCMNGGVVLLIVLLMIIGFVVG